MVSPDNCRLDRLWMLQRAQEGPEVDTGVDKCEKWVTSYIYTIIVIA